MKSRLLLLKSTGVIRRIDELGRIVLPKELRRTMRLHVGENLEIFTNDNSIILQKYSAIKDIDQFTNELCELMSKYCKKNIYITDTEKIISVSPKILNDFIGLKISNKLTTFYNDRQIKLLNSFEDLIQNYGNKTNNNALVRPINVLGDILGFIIIEGNPNVSDTDKTIINFAGKILESKLEI